MSGTAGPYFKRVELAPHPEYGLIHLERWFGRNLVVTKNRKPSADMTASVFDAPSPVRGRDRLRDLITADLRPLNGGKSPSLLRVGGTVQ